MDNLLLLVKGTQSSRSVQPDQLPNSLELVSHCCVGTRGEVARESSYRDDLLRSSIRPS